MRPPIRHLIWVLAGFSLAALPIASVRTRIAEGYSATANAVLLERSELGRGGKLSLEPDTEKHQGVMSQDAALVLSARRKPRAVVFGVNLRRDAYLPFVLALLTGLLAPTRTSIRLGAAALAGAVMFGLSLLSFRAIAAWYFLVHGKDLMVYLPDPSGAKLAKVLYKALLSQPNYRLALAAGVGAGALWLLGYHPLRGTTDATPPYRRWFKRVGPSG